MKPLKIFSILMLTIVSYVTLYGQMDDRQLFDRGIRQYKNSQYTAAQNTFIQILKNYPTSRILTATKLMLAKSYYKQGDLRAAGIVCDNFIQVNRKSNYQDDIHFLRGKIYYKKRKYSRAVEEWLWLTYNNADVRLKKRAGKFVFQTMVSKMSDRDISRLKKKYSDEVFTGLVEVVQGQKLINSGRRTEGMKRLQDFVDRYPYNVYSDIARNIIQVGTGANVVGNRILIIKSSQDEQRLVSDALYQGIRYARYELQTRDPQLAISLDTLTTDPGILHLLKTTTEYLETNKPLAVVGPVENDPSAALSMLSKYEHFPFIIPLSSQTGLASLSPYAFQINPDAEIKGQFLAEHATRELGYKTFAILAPADAYGEEIAHSFQRTVEANGGEVVETQWYYEDTQDFSRQFKAIRKKGFYIAYRDSVKEADSTLSEETIRKQFKQYMTQVLFSDENVRGEIDSTQIPSTGIDALFIAGYPAYIPYLAPQFAFHNIRCALLGNEGWNDPEQLRQQRAYIDGIVYVTAGYLDKNSWNYREFTNRFRQEMQKTPGFYHLLGYDIGKWLISHFQSGITRQELRDALANPKLYRGILENIGFASKAQVNNQLNIVKFYLGQILKMK